MNEITDTIERRDFQSLRSSDFPATKFFTHLSNGTRSFRDKEFAKAISEWEEAAKLRPDFVDMKGVTDRFPFQSRLTDVPLVGLLYAIFFNAQTGVAIVRSGYVSKEVLFKEGWIVSARTTKSEERIGNFLLRRDLVSPPELEELAAQARKSGAKLGGFLVMKGLLLEKELRELLEFQIQEILCDLFSWKDGEFYFADRKVRDDEELVSYTPLDAALFAARRALDFSTFRSMIPHNKVVFHIPPYIEKDKTRIMEELDANEKFIFSLIDGNRNVDQLIKFSGNDEVSATHILYHLVLMGLIQKSKGIGIYEDKEFEEISQFLRIFSEIFRVVVDRLGRELGIGVTEVLDKARERLEVDYRQLFQGIPMDRYVPPDMNMILKNISLYHPDPPDRLIFIDGFYALIGNILQEVNRILGTALTKKVISDIDRSTENILRFYTDSPVKKRVLEAFDAMIDQFIM